MLYHIFRAQVNTKIEGTLSITIFYYRTQTLHFKNNKVYRQGVQYIRVTLKMEIPQIGLPTLLVVPMGTLRYHTKNGAHSMHPRVAIGGPIFTSMAM